MKFIFFSSAKKLRTRGMWNMEFNCLTLLCSCGCLGSCPNRQTSAGKGTVHTFNLSPVIEHFEERNEIGIDTSMFIFYQRTQIIPTRALMLELIPPWLSPLPSWQFCRFWQWERKEVRKLPFVLMEHERGSSCCPFTWIRGVKKTS